MMNRRLRALVFVCAVAFGALALAHTPLPGTGMTARECVLTCEGCCACAQMQGTRCIDWECC